MPVNPRSLRISALSLLLIGVGVGSSSSQAQSSIASLSYSFDTSTTFGLSTFADEEVARDNLLSSIIRIGLGLPSNADLTAYHRLPNGAQLFSMDTSVELPGLAEVRPSDVVRFDGINYSLAFSGVANGIPANASIDALAIASNGDFLISFDVPLDLPGGAAEDRDLLRWTGSVWSIFFDGADTGIPDGLDLDAAHLMNDGVRLLLSFDGSGTIEGIRFDDEDVLQFDLVSHSWSLFWDGSNSWSDAAMADLDALYVLERPSLIFADGFESGNTAAWSATVP